MAGVRHRLRVLMTGRRAGIRAVRKHQLCGITAAANEHRQVLLAIMLIGEWQTRLIVRQVQFKEYLTRGFVDCAKIGLAPAPPVPSPTNSSVLVSNTPDRVGIPVRGHQCPRAEGGF